MKLQGYLENSLNRLLINYQILLPNVLVFSCEWLGEFDIASKVTKGLIPHTPSIYPIPSLFFQSCIKKNHASLKLWWGEHVSFQAVVSTNAETTLNLYCEWKRSSGWLESWEGLLLVTDVSTTFTMAMVLTIFTMAHLKPLILVWGLRLAPIWGQGPLILLRALTILSEMAGCTI